MAPIAGKTLRRSSVKIRSVSSVWLALGVPAVLVVLVGCVAFILWPRWPGPAATLDAPSLPITIGGQVFNVPPAAIRVPLQRHAGPHERIDLAFLWPELTPPDPTAKPALREEPLTFDRLFISLAGLSGTVSAAERYRQIYPRYFAQGQFAGPDGLIVKRFRDGTPYQGDDLFYDPIMPDPFMARCSRPGAGETPGTCLVERRIAGAVDVTVRFPRDWLSEWRTLANAIDHVIRSLQPRSG
jgi:hypothetical protein